MNYQFDTNYEKEQVQHLCSDESVALELDANKKRIMEAFAKYGIEILSTKAHISSTIALYEIVFAPVFSSMYSIGDDIYHCLSACGIKIVPSCGNGTACFYVLVKRPSKNNVNVINEINDESGGT